VPEIEPSVPRDSLVPEREGLPKNYRMRADAHYLDELDAAAPPVVRMVATRQIQCTDLPSDDRVETLSRSIAALGVLQPLLVRRQSGGYKLIAGRRRLAAAAAAGLTTVPCLLHDADDEAAAALAEAANHPAEPARPRPADRLITAAIRALSTDLAALSASTTLLKATKGSGWPHQLAGELVEAQVARAAWLARCAELPRRTDRLTSIGVIVDRVASGFDAYARLAGVRIETSVGAGAASWMLDEEATIVALTGCLFATVAWLEGIERPPIELRADAAPARSLKIEITQRAAEPPAPLARYLGSEPVRDSDAVPALALRALEAVATRHGGRVELVALPGGGSVIQATFAKTASTD
jgi:hypothetical protein